MAEAEVILEGAFGEFALDELFEVIGLSCQPLRVECVGFMPSGGLTWARAWLHSGRVLHALSGVGEPGQSYNTVAGLDAFTTLRSRDWRRYQVILAPPPSDAVPLGPLRTLVEEHHQSSPWTLGGAVGSIQMGEFLTLIGSSRPAMEFRVDDGTQAGRIVVRNGEVLGASYGDQEGLEAMVSVLSVHEGQYLLERCTTLPGTPPLGPLRALLDELPRLPRINKTVPPEPTPPAFAGPLRMPPPSFAAVPPPPPLPAGPQWVTSTPAVERAEAPPDGSLAPTVFSPEAGKYPTGSTANMLIPWAILAVLNLLTLASVWALLVLTWLD